jgi:exopolyphosphatase / guanosine-5'-triphosphate,3'-diphosphate pyrophosphatase
MDLLLTDLHAALDLGSNSFHLLLARRVGDTFTPVERMKEKVQLLSGFRDSCLTDAAMARGEACLARFAQRLAALPRANVRMVGTHALREADNREAFRVIAERIIGVPLEIVSGDEEARLIYLGVAHHAWRPADEARLVIDVGGGSTELAWSRPPGASAASGIDAPVRTASCKVGCVSLTDRFFGGDFSQQPAFSAARAQAKEVFQGFEPIAPGCSIIGTSGTVESLQTVLAANGWGAEAITPRGLGLLTEAIVSGRWLVDAGLPGLPPDRVDIFPAGVALVDALFEVLGIESMRYVDASLQDGLLYRDLGHPRQEVDHRAREVAELKRRFQVDDAQAMRVRATALALFDGSTRWWTEPERWRPLLGWAAELHELGMAIAPRHYHRHGAYVLQNSVLKAFSRAEQGQLALLVRGHRRSFPGLAFRAYEPAIRSDLERLLALLRIAVILNRSHSDDHAPAVAIDVDGDSLRLRLPTGWLASHPLSSRELEVEAGQLQGARLQLIYG